MARTTNLRQLPFLYGTAWKKEATTELVVAALRAGFRGIDTACQPRHYREDLVGQGMRQAISEGVVKREDLWIQTKFTSVDGQDRDNIPYSVNAPLVEQVKTSIQTSLKNLRSNDSDGDVYIDCLVLHSPMRTIQETIEVWKTVSTFYPQIRSQGISNTDLNTLKALHDAVEHKPVVVQNRFYSRTKHDVALRQFCRDKGIMYESFWTLTGNRDLLTSAPVLAVAKAADISREMALYVMVLSLENTVILNGTTSEQHMTEDLTAVESFNQWKSQESNAVPWRNCQQQFRELIGEPAV